MQSRIRLAAVALAALAFAAGCSRGADPVRPAAATHDPVGAPAAGALRASVDANLPPEVQITSPLPSNLIRALAPPTVTIRWRGHDPDGAEPGTLAGYRFKLIPADSPEFQWAHVDPDSLRRRYAPAYDGWESAPGEQTSQTYEGLVPNKSYLFVVVGFDAEGASTEVFSLNTNMLSFLVTLPGAAGPRFTVWSDSFRHEFLTGGYIHPSLEVHYDVAAPELLVHWSAEPIAGSRVEAYRWAVDIADPADQGPRRGPVDLRHWSAWEPAGTTATVTRRFPPPPSGSRRLYIEALDSIGFTSRVVIELGLASGRPAHPEPGRGETALR